MARIRTIKPEMFTSATVSAWPFPVRWTFVGLFTYLDDRGRGRDDARLIKAAVFPQDDTITHRRVAGYVDEIVSTGPVCRYEVDGVAYLHVTTWDEHQRVNRPTPSRIPPCPVHEMGEVGPKFEATHGNETVTGGSVGPKSGLTEDSLSPHGVSSPQIRGHVEGENSLSPHGGLTVGTGNREQGTGKGTGKGGRRVSRPTEPPPDDTPPTPTQVLLDEWIGASTTRPPSDVIDRIGRQVHALLTEGQPYDDVRRGLAAWARKGLHPNVLPSVVHETRTTAGRRGTTDQRVESHLDLVAKLRAEESPQPRQIGA